MKYNKNKRNKQLNPLETIQKQLQNIRIIISIGKENKKAGKT